MKSWNHKISKLPTAVASAYAGIIANTLNPKIPLPRDPSRWGCAGRHCNLPVTHICSFIFNRRGVENEMKRHHCDKHTLKFAKRFKIPVAVEHERNLVGTPKDLQEAIGNALNEMFGFLRTNGRGWSQTTTDTFLAHIRDRLAQDFSTMAFESQSSAADIMKLWNRIFPSNDSKSVEMQKKLKQG